MAHRPQRAPLMTADRLRAIIEKIPMRDHTTTDPVTATNTSNDNPNTFTGIQLTPVIAIDDTTAAESALATSSSTIHPHSTVGINEIDASNDIHITSSSDYRTSQAQTYQASFSNSHVHWNRHNIWSDPVPTIGLGSPWGYAPYTISLTCSGPCGESFDTSSSNDLESRCRHCRNLPRPEGVIGRPSILFKDDSENDIAEYEGRVCLRGGGDEEEEEEEDYEDGNRDQAHRMGDKRNRKRCRPTNGRGSGHDHESNDDGYDGDDEEDKITEDDDNDINSENANGASEDNIKEANEQLGHSPFGDQYAVSEPDFASDSTLVEEKNREYRLSWRTRHQFMPLGSEPDPDNTQDVGLAQWATITQDEDLHLDGLMNWIRERDTELERNRLRYEHEESKEHESEHSGPATTFSPINSIVQTSNIVPVSRTLRQAYSPEEDSNSEEEEHEQEQHIPPPGQMPLGPYIALMSESSGQSSHHDHSNVDAEEFTQEERRELEGHLAAMRDDSEHGSEVDDNEPEEAPDEGHESDEGAEDGHGSNLSWGGATLLGYQSDLDCRFSGRVRERERERGREASFESGSL